MAGAVAGWTGLTTTAWRGVARGVWTSVREDHVGLIAAGVAFYALLPQFDKCPYDLKPVWRAYNGRAAQMDSNHRFTTDAGQRAAMGESWLDEGAHLCAAG